jgi:hypothetical protein
LPRKTSKSAANSERDIVSSTKPSEPSPVVDSALQLDQLAIKMQEMGFSDMAENKNALKKAQGNLSKAIEVVGIWRNQRKEAELRYAEQKKLAQSAQNSTQDLFSSIPGAFQAPLVAPSSAMQPQVSTLQPMPLMQPSHPIQKMQPMFRK